MKFPVFLRDGVFHVYKCNKTSSSLTQMLKCEVEVVPNLACI